MCSVFINILGNLRDAVACYERAIQTEPCNVKHHKGLLQCLIGLGQLYNGLMDVSGVMEERYIMHSGFCSKFILFVQYWIDN